MEIISDVLSTIQVVCFIIAIGCLIFLISSKIFVVLAAAMTGPIIGTALFFWMVYR